MPPETPSQTAGPYVHIGLTPGAEAISSTADLGTRPFTEGTDGAPVVLTGTVFDGEGEPLKDAIIEIWQADASGRYPDRTNAPRAAGWARTAADPETGTFRFDTIRPGRVDDAQAPHITLWIVARGINLGLQTRVYFEGDAANATDPILTAAGDRARTLIARQDGNAWRFDIHLQGPDETVFLDI